MGNKLKLVGILFLTLSFVWGCASTGTKTAGVGEGSGAATAGAEDLEESTRIEIKEYVVGVGDSINVSVFRREEFNRSVSVDSSGMVMFPLIGDVPMAGQSVFAIRDDLTGRLSKYIVNPQVMISVTGIQSQKFMVLGEVQNPGVFPLDSEIRISEAVVKAGGVSNDAQQKNVLLLRRGGEKQEIIRINLKDIYTKLDLSQDYFMSNQDIIYVPPKKIAVTARFMSYITQIIAPVNTSLSTIVLSAEAKDIVTGETGGSPGVETSIPLD